MTRRVWTLCLIAVAVVVVGPTLSAAAHPLGNFTVNRYSEIHAGIDYVRILYVVDFAEIPTFQELGRIDRDRDDAAEPAELDAYAEATAPRLARSLFLSAAGESLSLKVRQAGAELRPGQGGLQALRIEMELDAVLPARRTVLRYRDGSFSGRVGWKEVVARAVGEQGLARSSVPSSSVSGALTSYPKELLSSPLAVTEATLELSPRASATPTERAVNSPPASIDIVGGWFSSLVEQRLSLGFTLVALGLAALAGALHALGPGHGKTIMAAYLVGVEGRMRHALTIGLAVSAMHTVSVLALGVVTLAASSLFPPEAVFPWLSLASGIAVLGLGAWLLTARLRRLGSSRHDHDHHHHEVGHGHHIPPPAPGRSPLSAGGLAAVALSGGLLPSPSALVVLLGAIALHRVVFGLVLVVAFSFGLAAALVAVGAVVLKAHSIASRRLGARTGILLPIGSASLIVVVGLFLTSRALIGL